MLRQTLLVVLAEYAHKLNSYLASLRWIFVAVLAEYAFTMKATEKCDIYSFRVVLLKLLTGQHAIQPLEKGGDLVNLVRRTMNSMSPNSKVFDNRLNLNSKRVVEEMILLLKIALFWHQ